MVQRKNFGISGTVKTVKSVKSRNVQRSESAQLRKDLLDETKQRIDVEKNKKIYSAREQAKDHLTRARHDAYLSGFPGGRCTSFVITVKSFI